MTNFSHLFPFRKLVVLCFICLQFVSCASGSGVSKKLAYARKDSSMENKLRQNVIEYARYFLDKPYKKGGKDEKGFDCSGFVSYVMKNYGVDLGSSATEQFKEGLSIKIEEAKPGDLIFFVNKNKIQHVGIISEHKDKKLMVIHSSSSLGVIEENILASDYWVRRMRYFTRLTSYLPNKIVTNP